LFEIHGKLLIDLELKVWILKYPSKIQTSATGVCCHMEEFQEVCLGTSRDDKPTATNYSFN